MFASSFRFLNSWVEHPSFMNVVDYIWRLEVKGCPLYRVVTKVKKLKPPLKDLHKAYFSEISIRIKDTEAELVL